MDIHCFIPCYLHALFVFFFEACDVRNAGLGYDPTIIN